MITGGRYKLTQQEEKVYLILLHRTPQPLLLPGGNQFWNLWEPYLSAAPNGPGKVDKEKVTFLRKS